MGVGFEAGPLVVPREGLQHQHLLGRFPSPLRGCEEVMGMQPKVLLP